LTGRWTGGWTGALCFTITLTALVLSGIRLGSAWSEHQRAQLALDQATSIASDLRALHTRPKAVGFGPPPARSAGAALREAVSAAGLAPGVVGQVDAPADSRVDGPAGIVLRRTTTSAALSGLSLGSLASVLDALRENPGGTIESLQVTASGASAQCSFALPSARPRAARPQTSAAQVNAAPDAGVPAADARLSDGLDSLRVELRLTATFDPGDAP
jgi:hypothetical protein